MDDFSERDVPRSQTRAVAELATAQHGVVALRQLRALGVSNRVACKWVDVGRLHRVHRGVYTVGTRRLSAKGRWLAAVLACGDGAALSHRAAAALARLRPWRGGPVDVTVVSRGRRALAGVKVHCSRRPPETTIVDGIRVTTVARTLLDLATTVGPQELRLAVEAAERREVFDLRAIDALAAHGHHGLGKLRNAIEAAGGGAPWTRSGFENDFLAFLRARGFPEPQVNVLVCGELADFWWPEARLVVETDSWPFHRGRRRFREDRRRDAVLTVNGIRSVRVTDDQFRDEPHAVEAILRALL